MTNAVLRQNSVCLGSSLSMRSFAIEDPGSPVPALYATLGITTPHQTPPPPLLRKCSLKIPIFLMFPVETKSNLKNKYSSIFSSKVLNLGENTLILASTVNPSVYRFGRTGGVLEIRKIVQILSNSFRPKK